MPLKAYEEFAKEPLAFPINGKTYVVPPLPFEAGIRLVQLFKQPDEQLVDLDVEPVFKDLLGPVWDDMKADGVPYEPMFRAGYAALADFQVGREFAENTWEAGPNPERIAALMAAKSSSPASTPSPSTAEASETPTPASTSGTTSPKTSRARRASQSTSSSSSNSGS